MEYTREFRITVSVYHDTNKQTYEESHTFDSYAEAAEWLAEQSEDQ